MTKAAPANTFERESVRSSRLTYCMCVHACVHQNFMADILCVCVCVCVCMCVCVCVHQNFAADILCVCVCVCSSELRG